MRTAILALLVLGMATLSWAGPMDVKSTVPVKVVAPEQTLCWYQAPHYYLWTLNASTAFGSEFADDVPPLSYTGVYGFLFYAGEWANYWRNPAGFYLNVYYSCCPPGITPDIQYYFAWGNPGMSLVNVWYSPGWFESYEVTQDFALGGAGCFSWRDCTSVGVVLDTPWGATAPYGGAATTDYYVVYGCGQGYWCFYYYGIYKWTTVQGYFGVPADLAYGVFCDDRPTATTPSTWGAVKSLYE